MRLQILFFISLLFLSPILLGQETILDRFQASMSKDQVILSWTIEQGSTCNGISITRSGDSLSFYEIGDIEGVCGSESEAVDYTFLDTKPLSNRTNFYRLELGDVGSSEIISIDVIILSDDGYIVIPNPVLSNSKIHFLNERSEVTELDLFDANGRIISQLSTTESYFNLNSVGVTAGLYLFRIYRGENAEIAAGKIIVP